MQFGMHLRELSGQRRGVILSALLAGLLAFSSLYTVTLGPPGVHPRGLEIGAAPTSLIVDTARSQLTDVSSATVTPALAIRTALLGNIVSSRPVIDRIARLMAISPTDVAASSRNTANVPRVQVEPGSGANATEILSSPDRYRVEVQADPTVPILHVYAQAPSAPAAARLANATVRALRDDVAQLAAVQHIPDGDRLRLVQLGPAIGGVVNPGANVEIGLLVFLGAFGIGCCATLFVSRTRRGWELAKRTEPLSP